MTLNSQVGAQGRASRSSAGRVRRAAELLRRRWPSILAWTIHVIAWGFAAMFLGLLLGSAVVYLPLTGAIGIVAVIGLVLLWAMPDLAAVPDGFVCWWSVFLFPSTTVYKLLAYLGYRLAESRRLYCSCR